MEHHHTNFSQNKSRYISIQIKLAIVLLAITTAIFSGYGVYQYTDRKSKLMADLIYLTDKTADKLSSSLGPPLWNYSIDAVEEIVLSEMKEKRIAAVLVKKPDGKKLFTGKMRKTNGDIIDVSAAISGEYITTTEEIVYRDEDQTDTPGIVDVYVTPNFMIEELQHEVRKIFTTIILVNLALLGSLIVALRNMVVHPIQALEQATQQFSIRDFTVNVPVRSSDEIGMLAMEFNTMARQLQESFLTIQQEVADRRRAEDALQELNEELEARVNARTAELAQAKTDLEMLLEMNIEHSDQIEEDLLDKIDATLRESEQRFRVITKTIPIPIVVSLQADHTIMYANEPANVFFGSGAGTIVGHNLSEFYEMAAWQQIEEVLKERDVVRNYELQGYRGEGSLFWGALHLQPLIFNEEPCLLSALYDMTERKQAEEALSRERTLLRTLIDNIPDFIYVKDQAQRYLIANIPVMRSAGVTTHDDIVGKTDSDLFPDIADHSYEAEQRVIDTGQPLLSQEDSVRDQQTGEITWLLTTKVPIRDSHGDIAGLVGISRNVTELKRVQEELQTLNQELEARVQARTIELRETNQALLRSMTTLQMAQDQLVQAEKMAALGTLVAGVAHEINTPVGIGITAVSFLETKTQELQHQYRDGTMHRSDLEHYLHTAGESTRMILQNLQRAAEQIQSFKQVAVDQVSTEERRFKLKSYLDDLLLSLHPRLKQTHHTITIHCADDLEIMSYPGAFSQIFTNLILNSLIHGFEGVEQGKILIDITTDHETLQLCYHDTGKGMTKDICSHIFEPFYTTKRGQGNTGLGMHIVYNLVTQQLHGTIRCESTEGIGTTVVIQIPIV